MKGVFLLLLVLVNLSGSLAQEGTQHDTDLKNKVFVFPTASKTAHVVLKPPKQQSLSNFTVCLRSYTDQNRLQSIFSYAGKRGSSEILVERKSPNEYRLHVGKEYTSFNMEGREIYTPSWEHVCVSWESATGLATFWLNGQSFPRKGLKKGYSISPEASIFLGHHHDFLGHIFGSNDGFVGEITDVYMFDRALTPNEVDLLLIRSPLPKSEYMINWRSLSYDIKGYVLVKQSMLWSY